MKKIILQGTLILMLLITLAGCFHGDKDGSSDVGEQLSGFRLATGTHYTIQVPDDWETLPPKHGELAVFRSSAKHPIFTATIALLKNDLPATANSLQYANVLLEKVKSELLGVQELRSEKMKIEIAGEDHETLFTIVEGSEGGAEDKKRFVHFSGVKGNIAIVAVGAYAIDEKEEITKKVEEIVKSLKLK